jgi:putative transposase
MSTTTTTTAGVLAPPSGVPARPIVPLMGDEPAMREFAEALVDRARRDGVQLTGDDGLLTALIRQVLQTSMNVELSEHLGYEPHAVEGRGSGNSRNGSYPKTVTTEIGKVTIDMPRDRNGSFEPVLVPKGQRRLDGFDANVISLYAKGMTTGDIQAYLAEIYQTDISRETISKITDAVVEDMQAWQSRPLDRVYPVILIDAIVIKIRDGQVANRPVYVAMGINMNGDREILGMWVGPTGGEGAKWWLNVLTELRNRGIADAFIVCCDGLKGLPEAIRATWPLADVQLCVVHLVRSALRTPARNTGVRSVGTCARSTPLPPSLPLRPASPSSWSDGKPAIQQ